MTETLARERPASERGASRIAVCVSGQGSNLRALRRAAGRDALGAEIVLVLADRDCPALQFAAREGLPTAIVQPGDHRDLGEWDETVASALRAARPDLVVLAGFMRRLGAAVLSAFPGRILNVHPSLLPAFPGRHAVADALAAGVKVTGVTVHVVDETLDGGPIIVQRAVAVLDSDTEATLSARILAEEHGAYAEAVALVLGGRYRVEGRRVVEGGGEEECPLFVVSHPSPAADGSAPADKV